MCFYLQATRATVTLNVKGAWDDLQIVITRNTVDDFQKIVAKLQSFFQVSCAYELLSHIYLLISGATEKFKDGLAIRGGGWWNGRWPGQG